MIFSIEHLVIELIDARSDVSQDAHDSSKRGPAAVAEEPLDILQEKGFGLARSYVPGDAKEHDASGI
jgi:hypothetical protein